MDLVSISSWAILIISILMMIFQLLLAFGLPLGKYAWGGYHTVLPKNLRIGSFVSAIIFFVAILISLHYLSLITFLEGYAVLDIVLWFYFVLFALSTFANIMSKSKMEKRIMIPVALILAISFLILAVQEIDG